MGGSIERKQSIEKVRLIVERREKTSYVPKIVFHLSSDRCRPYRNNGTMYDRTGLQVIT